MPTLAPVSSSASAPAHAALKTHYPRTLELALLAGLTVHLAVLFLTPPLAVEPYRLPEADAFHAVDVAEPEPEIRVIEPPEDVSTASLAAAWEIPAVPELEERPDLPEVAPSPFSGPKPFAGSGSAGSGVIVDERYPVVLKRVVPEYPALAREAGAEGTVQVRVRVDVHGRVVTATVVDSDTVPALNHAALDAARGFLFSPALQQGNPVPFRTVLTFEFKLH